MAIEYEAKYLDIDPEIIRKKLRKLGAVKVHPMVRMIRSTYNHCNGENKKAFVRVRQEANKVTMTSKIMDTDYPKEYEVTIQNTYEQGKDFLESLNIKQKAVQETYREKWQVPKMPNINEIVIDMIPGIPMYMEIDSTDEKGLLEMERQLEMDTSKKEFGAFAKQYEQYYGIDQMEINNSTPSLTFANIHQEIQPRKNHEKLQEIQMAQLTVIKTLKGLGKRSKKRVTNSSRKQHKRTRRYSHQRR